MRPARGRISDRAFGWKARHLRRSLNWRRSDTVSPLFPQPWLFGETVPGPCPWFKAKPPLGDGPWWRGIPNGACPHTPNNSWTSSWRTPDAVNRAASSLAARHLCSRPRRRRPDEPAESQLLVVTRSALIAENFCLAPESEMCAYQSETCGARLRCRITSAAPPHGITSARRGENLRGSAPSRPGRESGCWSRARRARCSAAPAAPRPVRPSRLACRRPCRPRW